MTETTITQLSGLEAKLEPVEWAFARDRRPEIDANWQKAMRDKPSMFNGTVLMQHRWSLHDGVYHAAYTPVDYASFLAWIAFGQPGPPRRNGFAMGALQSADGAFILGVMAEHTVNAGKIYFPAGTPDMDDVTPSGEVDLAGSLTRELFEETALRPDEVEVLDRWTMVNTGYRTAFLKPVRLPYDATTARRLLLERQSQTDGELADFHIVRTVSDIIDARTPEFASAYMRSVLRA